MTGSRIEPQGLSLAKRLRVRTSEEKFRGVQATRISTRRQRKGFYPPFPIRIGVAIRAAKAEKALLLILAIHRQIVMKRCRETVLNGAIWDAAGNPTKAEKAAILRNLKAVPHIIRLVAKQSPTSYYRVAKGPLWDQADQE